MLKVVNYFWERISSENFGWVLNTSLIFKLLRENLSTICSQPNFVSYQNIFLARLSHSSGGTCSLFNIYMSSLKVIVFDHFFFLESLNKNVLQYYLYYNITFCISTCIMNNQPFILHVTCLWFAGTLAKPKHVGNAFTYLNFTKRLLTDRYAKQLLPHFSRYFTSHLLSLI